MLVSKKYNFELFLVNLYVGYLNIVNIDVTSWQRYHTVMTFKYNSIVEITHFHYLTHFHISQSFNVSVTYSQRKCDNSATTLC